MRLSFFEDALAEIEESRAWYRARSESAEAAFLHEIDHAVRLVQDAPYRWPAFLSGTRRYVFPTFPYSLVYLIEDEIVNVVAVAHDKRRPGYWRKRLRQPKRPG
jgi:plasmid stabilization system protein ParE